MSIKKMSARSIAAGGLVAGLYIALTALFAPMSFGAIQFRVSEALTLLPILSPAAVPGLFEPVLAVAVVKIDATLRHGVGAEILQHKIGVSRRAPAAK